MNEEIIHIGDGGRLSGVLSSPIDPAGAKQIVIFLNAGIVHRIGPNRLHVKLARQLAALGAYGFRLDLSGLGESASAPAGLDYQSQAMADVYETIDHLTDKIDVQKVILVGLCSGADYAYQAARDDGRVVGVALLDPYAYQSRAGQLNYLAKRATSPAHLKSYIGKLTSGRASEPSDVTADNEADPENDRVPAPREEFGADLERLVQRGVRLFIRYSSAEKHLINRRSQFFSTFSEFDFGDQIDVDVYGDIDHTYTTLSAQDVLKAALSRWFEASFLH